MKTFLLFCLLLLTAFPAPIHVDLDNDVIAVPLNIKYSPKNLAEAPDLASFSDLSFSLALQTPCQFRGPSMPTPTGTQACCQIHETGFLNSYCQQSPVLRI